MNRWLVLVTLSMSMFIIVIDTTIMNVSIGALVADLDTTVGGVQAAIALYALVMASFMLIGGKLADFVGKRRVFIAGVVIFGIGTFIASISTSLFMLIIGWSFIEGLGSALMVPNIQTILRDRYQGAERAFAYGIISAVAAVGAAVGPIVGGYLTTFHTWRWAFRLEVVIVVIVILLCRSIAADKRQNERHRFDVIGAVLSVIGWSCLVLGILLGQNFGFWRAKQPLLFGSLEIAPFGLSISPILAGLGLIFIMLLFLWERNLEENGREGLFKPSVFGVRGLKAGLFGRFVQMGVTAAFLFTLPLMLQLKFEFTAMQTGISLFPFSIALLAFAILGARLSARFSPKRLIQAGFVLAIIGLIVIAVTITPDATPNDLASGALFGLGVGLIASQILNLIMSSVPAEDTAEVSGLNGTFEQLGNALGVALVGTMMLTGLVAGLEDEITANRTIAVDRKLEIVTAAESGVQLMSDTQLKEALQAAQVSQPVEAEIIGAYSRARTQSFRHGMWFLVFICILGFLTTFVLPERKILGT